MEDPVPPFKIPVKIARGDAASYNIKVFELDHPTRSESAY
jgi:hypothetical protein